jgi:hypothetical protein
MPFRDDHVVCGTWRRLHDGGILIGVVRRSTWPPRGESRMATTPATPDLATVPAAGWREFSTWHPPRAGRRRGAAPRHSAPARPLLTHGRRQGRTSFYLTDSEAGERSVQNFYCAIITKTVTTAPRTNTPRAAARWSLPFRMAAESAVAALRAVPTTGGRDIKGDGRPTTVRTALYGLASNKRRWEEGRRRMWWQRSGGFGRAEGCLSGFRCEPVKG